LGFFSKVFKGIKKVFKKIGSGIKKIAGKIGKVVGKLGIVGQIGLMFIMPGVGGLLAKGFGALTGGLLGATGTGIMGTLARGVGNILSTAGKFASTVGNVFSSVTEGISSFISKVGGKVLEKVGLKVATEGTLTEAFQGWMGDTAKGFSEVLDPFKLTNKEFAASLVPKPVATVSDVVDIDVPGIDAVQPSKLKGVKDFESSGMAGEDFLGKIEPVDRFKSMTEISNDLAKEYAESQTKGKGVLDFLNQDIEVFGTKFNLGEEARDAIFTTGKNALNNYLQGTPEEIEDRKARGVASYSSPASIQMAQDYYTRSGYDFGATTFNRMQMSQYQPTDAYQYTLQRGLSPTGKLRI